MPILRYSDDDGGIGQALGSLAQGFAATQDPSLRAKYEMMRQQINASKANQAQTELQSQELQRQQAAQQGAIDATNKLFDNQYGMNFTPQTVTAPLPPGVQGPPQPIATMPGTQDKLGWLKAQGANTVMRGGSATDQLGAATKLLGTGNVLTGGAPTSEQAARTTQTLLTGQLPDAKTPLTDVGRQQLGAEDVANANAKELFRQGATPIKQNPDETVYVPNRIAGNYGLQPGQNGQTVIPASPTGSRTADQKNFVADRESWTQTHGPNEPYPYKSLGEYMDARSKATVQTAETTADQERGRLNAKELGGYAAEGNQAADQGVTLDRLEQLLGGVDTGKRTQLLEDLRQSTGIALDPNTDKVQAAQAIISKLIPNMRPSGAGSTSDYEEKLYAKGLAGLANTPGGNAEIIRSMRTVNQLALQRAQIASQWQQGKLEDGEALAQIQGLRQKWLDENRRLGVQFQPQGSPGGAQAPAGGAPAIATPSAPAQGAPNFDDVDSIVGLGRK